MTKDHAELIGLAEIAAMLEVSRSRADQLVRQKGFPEPVATIGRTRGWARTDVEDWIRENRGQA